MGHISSKKSGAVKDRSGGKFGTPHVTESIVIFLVFLRIIYICYYHVTQALAHGLVFSSDARYLTCNLKTRLTAIHIYQKLPCIHFQMVGVLNFYFEMVEYVSKI